MKEKKCHEKRVIPDCYLPMGYPDPRCRFCNPIHCYMINTFYFFLSCLDLVFRICVWVGIPVYIIFMIYSVIQIIINLWNG